MSFSFRLACLLLGAFSTLEATNLTGKISDLTGKSATNQTYVRFTLQNCTANVPRITGSTSFAQKVTDILPDGTSALHGQIAGNDAITCDSAGTTYYLVQVWNGQTKWYEAYYYITGTLWNIVSANTFNPQTGLPSGNPGNGSVLIGDVSTNGANATVSGLAGKPLASSATNPNGGSALVYNSATGKWTPTYIPQVLYLAHAPTSSDGNNGDTAIDTLNKQICGPKANGAWPPCTSLSGSTGTGGVSPIVRHAVVTLTGGVNLVDHNLGTKLFDTPVITDDSGNPVGFGDFQAIDTNSVSITMAPGFSGTAYLTGYVLASTTTAFPFANATSVLLTHNQGTTQITAVAQDANRAPLDYTALTVLNANAASLTFASPVSGTVYLTTYTTNGQYYEADFAATQGGTLSFSHGLGTQSVLLTVYDSTWTIVGVQSLGTSDVNTVSLVANPPFDGHILISKIQQ